MLSYIRRLGEASVIKNLSVCVDLALVAASVGIVLNPNSMSPLVIYCLRGFVFAGELIHLCG